MTTTITTDLSKTEKGEDVRALGMAATVILMALPSDEAEVAVERWRLARRAEFPEPLPTYEDARGILADEPTDAQRARLAEAYWQKVTCDDGFSGRLGHVSMEPDEDELHAWVHPDEGESPRRVPLSSITAQARAEFPEPVSGETGPETRPRKDDFVEDVTSTKEDVTSEPAEGRAEPGTTEEGVTSEPKDVTSASGSSHEFRGVTYQEKPRGRGARDRRPNAAFANACKAVATCDTVDELEAMRPELAELARWFADLGLPELDQDLTKAVALRSGQLVNAEDAPKPFDDDGEVAAVDAAGTEAEPTEAQDEIPFEPLPSKAEKRAGPPTPRTEQANGAEEPLRDLAGRAQDELGRKFLRDLLHKHGAIKLSDLGPAEAAFRADLEAAL
jgi:hypothetical protein